MERYAVDPDRRLLNSSAILSSARLIPSRLSLMDCNEAGAPDRLGEPLPRRT